MATTTTTTVPTESAEMLRAQLAAREAEAARLTQEEAQTTAEARSEDAFTRISARRRLISIRDQRELADLAVADLRKQVRVAERQEADTLHGELTARAREVLAKLQRKLDSCGPEVAELIELKA